MQIRIVNETDVVCSRCSVRVHLTVVVYTTAQSIIIKICVKICQGLKVY